MYEWWAHIIFANYDLNSVIEMLEIQISWEFQWNSANFIDDDRGDSSTGLLGNGHVTHDYYTPVKAIHFTNVPLKSVTYGLNHYLALATSGLVFAFGDNKWDFAYFHGISIFILWNSQFLRL